MNVVIHYTPQAPNDDVPFGDNKDKGLSQFLEKCTLQTTYWSIPNRFKQQVFDFLESFAVQSKREYAREKEEEKETKEAEKKHFQGLIRKSTVANTLKEVANLVKPSTLEKLYDSAYENGKQSR